MKHGMCETRLYRTWKHMRGRCNTKSDKSYKYYGGKGVRIHDDWIEFLGFYNWAINNGYEDELEIDRIDGNGNYEPSNCHWITKKENNAVGKKDLFSNNTSGYVGVYYFKPSGKWASRITVNGVNIALGHYVNIEDAIKSRHNKELELYGYIKTGGKTCKVK